MRTSSYLASMPFSPFLWRSRDIGHILRDLGCPNHNNRSKVGRAKEIYLYICCSIFFLHIVYHYYFSSFSLLWCLSFWPSKANLVFYFQEAHHAHWAKMFSKAFWNIYKIVFLKWNNGINETDFVHCAAVPNCKQGLQSLIVVWCLLGGCSRFVGRVFRAEETFEKLWICCTKMQESFASCLGSALKFYLLIS